VSLFATALVLLLGWGVLAIGGWPSWAAAPLLVFGVVTGVLGFLERDEQRHASARLDLRHGAVTVGLAMFVAAIGIQLVPLPETLVRKLNPARDELQYERLLAIADRRDPLLVHEPAAGGRRPLTIAPSRTWLGFAGALGFSIFLLGAARGLSRVGVRRITAALLILGVVVSFLGIYQYSNPSVAIYGLYVPLWRTPESAPFHNKNHQAGWLAMVLALALGALAGEVARGMRGAAPRWRDRLVWLSSKQANVAALTMFASAIIGVAILVTQSRSGAMAMAVIFTVVVLWSLRKQPTRTLRLTFAVSIAALMLAVFSYAGEGVAKRITTTSWQRMDGRVNIWHDTLNIANTFWLTGTGFNTYGVAMLRYQTVKDGYRYIEAHNDYLQLMAEGGLLVGIPAIILAITLIVTIYRRFREGADDTRTYWLRVGAVAGICAIAVQSVTDFTLQMPGAAVMFATLLAIAIHQPRPRPSREIA
jgi:O-antigen ligase